MSSKEKIGEQKLKLTKLAFFPPLAILGFFLIFGIVYEDGFLGVVDAIFFWIRANVGWGASLLALSVVVVGVAAMFSKFGNVTIGGEGAKPELSTFAWVSIAMITTMAAGVLFWGPAEPIAHYAYPPTGLVGVEPKTPEAVKFAMETMFIHWTIIPYAIYTVPAVVFGFMYYNGKRPFSIASQMGPALGPYSERRTTIKIVDAITLFSIGAGMAGSVAQGFLSISSGLSNTLGIPDNAGTWLIIAIVLGAVVAFSAISGIQKGLKTLSHINVVGFCLLLLFLLIFSNIPYLLNLATEALGGFINNFFDRALMTGGAARGILPPDEFANSDYMWPQWWTTFYWFSWMAWAPTSGAFMGRIAYGRKVKHVLAMYIGLCASLSMFWMIVVSGTALWTETSGAADLIQAYSDGGAANVAFAILGTMPLGNIVSLVFVFLVALSLVTACDSNTIAMAGISTVGITPENPDAPKWIKLTWAFIVMGLGYIMIATIGEAGVRVIANFGGLVATIIMLGAVVSMILLIKNYKKYDKTLKDAPAEEKKEEAPASAAE